MGKAILERAILRLLLPPRCVVRRKMLEGAVFLKFFDKVVVANFEIASDAFSTFKVCANGAMRGKCFVTR